MASNDLLQLLAGANPSTVGVRSMLDETLRTILMRYAVSHPDPTIPVIFPRQQLLHQILASHEHMLPGSEPADVIGHVWSTVLEHERSDVASLARFAHRVDYATFHLCVAFEKAEVRFQLSRPRNVVQSSRGISAWYATLVNATFNRYRDLRNALVHHWTPPAEVEPLTLRAFLVLCDLTPADSQLRSLFATNRSRAFHELARHLDIVADQLKAAIQLAANLEAADADDESPGDQAQLDAVQTDILRKSGEPLSLTSAATRLGITRQALHKRIQAGSALGLMRGSELVVPAAQFVERDGKQKIVDGLSEIVPLFDETGAGRWSALQFLTEIDPSLRTMPLDALKRGDTDAAVAAARGYLSIDEA
jgi:hypothetical protein